MTNVAAVIVGIGLLISPARGAGGAPNSQAVWGASTPPMSSAIYAALQDIAPLATPDSRMSRFYAALPALPELLDTYGPLAQRLPPDFAEAARSAAQTSDPVERAVRISALEKSFVAAHAAASADVVAHVLPRAKSLLKEFAAGRLSLAELRAATDALRTWKYYGPEIDGVHQSLNAVFLKGSAGEMAEALRMASVSGDWIPGTSGPSYRERGPRVVLTGFSIALKATADKTPTLPPPPAPADDFPWAPQLFEGSIHAWLTSLANATLGRSSALTPSQLVPAPPLFGGAWDGSFEGRTWSAADVGAPAALAPMKGSLSVDAKTSLDGAQVLQWTLGDGRIFESRLPREQTTVLFGDENRLEAELLTGSAREAAVIYYTARRVPDNQVFLTGRIESTSGTTGLLARFSAARRADAASGPNLAFEDELASTPGNIPEGLTFDQVMRRHPAIAARLAIVAARGRLADLGRRRFIVLDSRPYGGGSRRYVNRSARTVVVLGPRYVNAGPVLSAGPIVLIDAKPKGDLRSLSEIILDGSAAPRGTVAGRRR